MRRLKNTYHKFVAIFANLMFMFPSRSITVIGVTGTDGKTTTSNLIYHILQKNHKKVALISTTGAYINNESIDTGFHVTTPNSINLQKLIKKVKDSDIEYLVLEVTSHSIDQNRIYGINFDYAVLTNITSEHLDYHKNFNNYQNTKLKFLNKAKTRILNVEDDSCKAFRNKYDNSITTYGIKSGDNNWQKIFGNIDFENISGEYNKYNILAAYSVAAKLGIAHTDIINAINTYKMPVGRFEVIYSKDFRVIVDFAHTPNSIAKVLSHIRSLCKNGRIIHVFGSAGERDAGKRPDMGKASSKYADVIILTSEDPRHENPQDIINQIESGIKKEVTVYKLPKRQEAIDKAIELAKKDDIVVITGKGHEKSMNVGGTEFDWDERVAVQKSLNNKHEDS